jgi:hypothetical protein
VVHQSATAENPVPLAHHQIERGVAVADARHAKNLVRPRHRVEAIGLARPHGLHRGDRAVPIGAGDDAASRILTHHGDGGGIGRVAVGHGQRLVQQGVGGEEGGGLALGAHGHLADHARGEDQGAGVVALAAPVGQLGRGGQPRHAPGGARLILSDGADRRGGPKQERRQTGFQSRAHAHATTPRSPTIMP